MKLYIKTSASFNVPRGTRAKRSQTINLLVHDIKKPYINLLLVNKKKKKKSNNDATRLKRYAGAATRRSSRRPSNLRRCLSTSSKVNSYIILLPAEPSRSSLWRRLKAHEGAEEELGRVLITTRVFSAPRQSGDASGWIKQRSRKVNLAMQTCTVQKQRVIKWSDLSPDVRLFAKLSRTQE